MWHTRTYFHSSIEVCDRFLEHTKLSRSGAWPDRELFIARLGLGAHGGANGLVPLLPASMCEPGKATRITLGKRHVEKCAMRKTLSGGFWIVSTTRMRDTVGVETISQRREIPQPERRLSWRTQQLSGTALASREISTFCGRWSARLGSARSLSLATRSQ